MKRNTASRRIKANRFQNLRGGNSSLFQREAGRIWAKPAGVNRLKAQRSPAHPARRADEVENELLTKIVARWKITKAKVADILRLDALKSFRAGCQVGRPLERWNLTDEQRPR